MKVFTAIVLVFMMSMFAVAQQDQPHVYANNPASVIQGGCIRVNGVCLDPIEVIFANRAALNAAVAGNWFAPFVLDTDTVLPDGTIKSFWVIPAQAQ